jgi:hypothetical protein
MNQEIQELINLSFRIAAKQSSSTVTIYAIQNRETGEFITHKKRKFYATREDARSIRRNIENPKLRVVKADFINTTDWKTSR